MNQQLIDDLKIAIDQNGPDMHAYILVSLDKNGQAKTKIMGNIVQVGYLAAMTTHHFGKLTEMPSKERDDD